MTPAPHVWEVAPFVAFPKSAEVAGQNLEELGGVLLILERSRKAAGRPAELGERYVANSWGGTQRRGAAVLRQLLSLDLLTLVEESDASVGRARTYQVWSPPKAKGFVGREDGKRWHEQDFVPVPVAAFDAVDAVLASSKLRVCDGEQTAGLRAALLGVVVRLWLRADRSRGEPIRISVRHLHQADGQGAVTVTRIAVLLEELMAANAVVAIDAAGATGVPTGLLWTLPGRHPERSKPPDRPTHRENVSRAVVGGESSGLSRTESSGGAGGIAGGVAKRERERESNTESYTESQTQRREGQREGDGQGEGLGEGRPGRGARSARSVRESEAHPPARDHFTERVREFPTLVALDDDAAAQLAASQCRATFMDNEIDIPF